jgi:hypothetical protein
MTILNKAKAHFREIANSGTGSIEVPEWDTTIYWKIGGQNFASQNKIMELTNSGKTAEALVEMMIMRSLDGDGKKLFRPMDKTEIMREVDPNVILKIVTAMGADDEDFNQSSSDTEGTKTTSPKQERAVKN